MKIAAILARAETGARLSPEDALALADCGDLGALMPIAAALRDRGHGNLVSYSRKVFIPLTQLCRDVCHYCTFAHPPRRGEAAYLDKEQVLAIARAGAKAGCKEALFTLGDKPELRYGAAREALARLGHDTTLSYLAEMAALVLKETGPAAAPQSRHHDPRRHRNDCAAFRCRRASCWKARASASRAAAARISARPTSIRNAASTASPRPAKWPCRSPPAS